MVEGQHVLAAEIIEDLQSALEELQAISEDLAMTPGAKEEGTELEDSLNLKYFNNSY